MRTPHPTWTRPKLDTLQSLSGGCDNFTAHGIDVVVSDSSLSNPTLQVGITCTKFAQGEVLETPFPLIDIADTNTEAQTLGVDTAQVTLDALCRTCEYRTKEI